MSDETEPMPPPADIPSARGWTDPGSAIQEASGAVIFRLKHEDTHVTSPLRSSGWTLLQEASITCTHNPG